MRLISLASRKIHNRESVEVGQLNEDPFRRTIGILGESHWAYSQVHLERPIPTVGPRVENVYRLPCNGAGNHVFTVRSNVGVVDAAPCR